MGLLEDIYRLHRAFIFVSSGLYRFLNLTVWVFLVRSGGLVGFWGLRAMLGLA